MAETKDLLQRFIKGKDFLGEEERNNGEEIELSLGLSLNGKFGVDPTSSSSSVSQELVMLGVENEEECRKRKELQSLRRMEAKKRRMEKLKIPKAAAAEEENSSEENGSSIDSNGKGMPLSQGSIGSQGSGSSGISQLHSIQPVLQVKQNSKGSEIPSSLHSKPLQNKRKPTNSPSMATDKSAALLGDDKGEGESNDMIKNVMANMPSVSTTGPNGKKIDGFLYRYGKGEEVSIMCVCHGSFLSPAEFVKHGGGDDVEHPLRHIVVNSSPFL